MSVTTLPHRWFVGIDLHKDTLTACVYCTCCGEIRFQKLSCKCRKQIAEFFGSLLRPHVVAIEAVGFYRWLWEMLEPLVDKLVLADATQARALAGRRMKTDREDAQNIAELLACGRLPLAYAPCMEVQVLRDCSRQRNALSRQHAHALHRAKSVMNANNRPGPARMDSAAEVPRYFRTVQLLILGKGSGPRDPSKVSRGRCSASPLWVPLDSPFFCAGFQDVFSFVRFRRQFAPMASNCSGVW